MAFPHQHRGVYLGLCGLPGTTVNVFQRSRSLLKSFAKFCVHVCGKRKTLNISSAHWQLLFLFSRLPRPLWRAEWSILLLHICTIVCKCGSFRPCIREKLRGSSLAGRHTHVASTLLLFSFHVYSVPCSEVVGSARCILSRNITQVITMKAQSSSHLRRGFMNIF